MTVLDLDLDSASDLRALDWYMEVPLTSPFSKYTFRYSQC